MGRLEGKVALVTGAARGIGFAIARRFREEGASVVVNDLHEEAAEKAAHEIGGLGLAADVSDSSAVARMFAKTAEELGRLDVLVNNAGVHGLEDDPDRAEALRQRMLAQIGEALSGGPVRTHLDAVVETSDASWQRVLNVHLNGTFFCTREALKIMNGSGSIVNMGSVLGTSGSSGMVAYGAAKAGILGFTRCAAREVASRGIRVNAIAPGWVDTEMTAFLAEARPLIELQTPLHRLGDPDDIAWAAVYLASDEARFVTGQVLAPNGGLYMSQ